MLSALVALTLAATASPDAGQPVSALDVDAGALALAGADHTPNIDTLTTPDAGEPVPTCDGGPACEPHHLDGIAVPTVTYSSDYGLEYGAAGELQWSGGADPYRYQIAAQFLRSTGGLSSHYLRYDAPRFLGTRLRFWSRVEYHRELYAPYYGAGNTSSDDLRDHPGVEGPHAFQFDRVLPTGRVGIGVPFAEHFLAYAFAGYTRVVVHPYADSLLEQEKPLGYGGGHDSQLTVGGYYDSRDHEAVPSTGTLIELSGRGSSAQLGSSNTYGGLSARWLQFVPLHRRLVLATRLEGDLLSRLTPFWALQTFGATDTIEGVGGQYSARGIPQNRYIGRGKLVGTVELRWRVLDHNVLGENASFGAVGFTDFGRVWNFDATDGPWPGVHAAVGGGLRAWRRALVLRLDLATSQDRPFNIYLLFGHFF